MAEGLPPWGYIFSTLIIRFVGVFVVLGVLQVGIQVSSRVIRRLSRSDEEGGRKAGPSPKQAAAEPPKPEAESMAPGVLSAIGIGLHLYMEEQGRGGRVALDSDVSGPVGSTAWQVYGRQEQFDNRKLSRPW